MADATYTLGDAPEIMITRCSGDVQLEAHGERTVIVTVSEQPTSRQEAGRLSIEDTDDHLRVRAPERATIQIADVDGHLSVNGLSTVRVKYVGGDCSLHDVLGPCAIRHVDGHCSVNGGGDLTIEHIDGDAQVEGVSGVLALESIDGHASIRGVLRSAGRMRVGGDLSLRGSFAPGNYDISVDGYAEIVLSDDANVAIQARAEGHVDGLQAMGEGYGATYGDGSALVRLTVEGDLKVRGPIGAVAGGWGSPAAPQAPQSPSQPVAAPAPITPPAPAPPEPPERPAPPIARMEGPAEGAPADTTLSVLEALARGELSPEEAERALATGVRA